MAKSNKRLSKELESLNAAGMDNISIDLVGESMTSWNVHIAGPKDTPYAGGKFTVNIDYSDNYPFKCPKI